MQFAGKVCKNSKEAVRQTVPFGMVTACLKQSCFVHLMKQLSVNPKKKKAHAPKFVPNFLELQPTKSVTFFNEFWK